MTCTSGRKGRLEAFIGRIADKVGRLCKTYAAKTCMKLVLVGLKIERNSGRLRDGLSVSGLDMRAGGELEINLLYEENSPVRAAMMTQSVKN